MQCTSSQATPASCHRLFVICRDSSFDRKAADGLLSSRTVVVERCGVLGRCSERMCYIYSCLFNVHCEEHEVRDASEENRDKSDDDAPLPFSDSDINLADKPIVPGLPLVRQVECSQHPFKPCEIDQSLQLG